MEVTTDEVARGNDNGNPNSECGGGRDGERPNRSGAHTTAKARAVHIQLQRRGGGFGGTGESAGSEAKPTDSDSSVEGSADHEPNVPAQNPSAQSLPAGAPADKGSEVPLNWRPPHAELNAAAVSAAEVSRQWETGVATPTPGADGRVVYIFGQGMPVMVCAPLRVCAIELQAGEHLESQPQIGDSRRWEITPVLSGSGLDETPLLIVKPIEAGLETDLIVSTDRRTYVFRLVSDPMRFVSRLAFQYPGEDAAKWAAFEIRQAAAKRDAEAVAEQAHEKDKRAGVVPMAENTLDNLYFDYKLSGDAAYRPEQVFDDGQHTYLIYPNDGRFRELPTLLIQVNGKSELVNFRVDGSRYIVDRLFDKAILVVGVGKKQTRVTIIAGDTLLR